MKLARPCRPGRKGKETNLQNYKLFIYKGEEARKPNVTVVLCRETTSQETALYKRKEEGKNKKEARSRDTKIVQG